jgi:hypothetical protein
MRASVLIPFIWIAILTTFVSCGKQQEIPPVVMPAPECIISPETQITTNAITVTLLDAVDPSHAPRPRNASEQLLFGHLYGTLITVDCRGKVQPALARSWSRAERGRRWTFELSEEARFWDGSPVLAVDIVTSWRLGLDIKAVHLAGIDSLSIAGDRTLSVSFDRPHRKVPRMFAEPAFAVAKRAGLNPWPLGTGPYQIEPFEGMLPGGSALPVTVYPSFDSVGPVIQFLEASVSDTRDLLDDRADIMITSDPAVIEYAASRPGLDTIALPWDKTYVILSTSRIQDLREGGDVGTLSFELLDSFAQDAVRTDARGHRSPSWWDNLRSCNEPPVDTPELRTLPRVVHSTSSPHRIVYALNDPVARDLAERVVALSTSDPDASPEAEELDSAIPGLFGGVPGTITEGLTMDELMVRIRTGKEFAYVVPVPLQPFDRCYEARKLIDQAPWLAIENVNLSAALVPLVDTRRYVIAGQDGIGLWTDWNANIFITGAISRER